MKRLYYISALLLTMAFAMALSCGPGGASKKQPIAKEGVLDLRGWNFETDGPVELTGVWDFYWKELLKPEAFQGALLPSKTGQVPVPGVWNDYQLPGKSITGFGYATYRLRVLLDPGQRALALNCMEMSSAYLLYINGKLVSSNGRVAKTRAHTIPQWIPRTNSFQGSGESLDIVLQISNFNHRWGGPWWPIGMGTREAMVRAQVLSIALTLFLVGSLVIMGLYHLSLFSLRRKDRAPLFFGLFCILVGNFHLLIGERFFGYLFPNFPWELLVKFEYASLFLGLPLFASYMHNVFPGIFKKQILSLSWITALLFTLPLVFVSTHLNGYQIRPYQGVMLITILYMSYVLLEAYLRKMEGVRTFGLGFLVLSVTVINDILFQSQVIRTGDFSSFGLFIFIFVQVYLLSTRSSRAFAGVEELTEQMETTVKMRTQEAEEGRQQLAGLSAVSREVSEAGDLPSVMTAVHAALEEHLGALTVWLLLVDRHSSELYMESYRLPKGDNLSYEQITFLSNFCIPLKPESGTMFRTYIRKRTIFLNKITEIQKSSVDLDIIKNFNFHSYIQLPLIIQNEVIGILAIGSTGRISYKHSAWLKLFANQTTGAVHSASLLARAERARTEIHELNEFSKKLNATTDLNEHLDHICAYVQNHYHVDGIIIARRDLAADALVHLYTMGPARLKEITRTMRIPLNEEGGMIFRTYKRKKPFYLSSDRIKRDIFRKDYVGMDFDRELVDMLQLNSFLLVPLSVQGEVIGMAMFSSYGEGSYLDRQDVPAIARFCEQIAGDLYTSSLLESIREKRQTADLARAETEVAAQEVEQLNRLSRRINETTDIQAVVDDVFAYFKDAFRIDGCVLYLYEPEPNELFILRYSEPLKYFETEQRLFPLLRFKLVPAVGTFYATFNRRKTFYLKDAQRPAMRARASGIDRLILEGINVSDILQVPLVIQNKTIGIMCLTRLEKAMRLEKEELRSIERTCEQIAGAIHGSSLFKEVQERTQELALTNQKLQDLDRAKTDFFANISHEFRTPLTLILAPVESILKGDYGQRIAHKNTVFTSILQNGHRLLRLINNLLDFTRIEAARMSLRKQKTDIVELLKYYKSSVESGMESKGLRINFEDKTDGLIASIDRELMEKAVMNLLSNSFKFTPAGGEVIVQLELVDEDHYKIMVQDDGIGLPEDKLESIFERFSQVDESASRKHEGTGIGLSLTREIVELHDGKITALNRKGKGSLFTISLPIGMAAEEVQDDAPEGILEIQELKPYLMAEFRGPGELPAANAAASGPHEHHILMVEDNADMRNLLRLLLEREYVVHAAVDGKEGLEKARTVMPDLILSDVMMPEMDGYEMTREIKSNPQTRDIPVILLSANADVTHRIEGLEEGADDYLTKPFNSLELLARIRNQIESRTIERELKKEKEERDKDFQQAALVQKTILTPRTFIEQIEPLEFEIAFMPMNNQVSGDYYNVTRLEEGIASVFLADATGHGTQAALSTMQIDLLYRECFDIYEPNQRFKHINTKFVSELRSKNYFTGIILDIFEDRISYSSAGHPDQFLIQAENKEVQMLRTKGGMIGMREGQTFELKQIPFVKGDMLFLFTDGIYEVFNKKREEFGEERFLALIQDGLSKGLFEGPMGKIIESIMGAVLDFGDGAAFEDDITLIGVRLK